MAAVDEIAARYGRTGSRVRRGRILAITAAAVLVAAFAAWLIWVATLTTPASAAVTSTTSRVVGPHLVSISFGVDATPGHRVACALEADDADQNIVGWRVVVYPASASRGGAHTEQVRTIRPAVAGLISRCWVA